MPGTARRERSNQRYGIGAASYPFEPSARTVVNLHLDELADLGDTLSVTNGGAAKLHDNFRWRRHHRAESKAAGKSDHIRRQSGRRRDVPQDAAAGREPIWRLARTFWETLQSRRRPVPIHRTRGTPCPHAAAPVHVIGTQRRNDKASREECCIAQASTVHLYSAMLKHPKERCTSCGLWKTRWEECSHCAKLPNRIQAAKVMSRPKSAPSPSPVPNHAAERCHSCGLWKEKRRECKLCATRPNRMQASVSQMLQPEALGLTFARSPAMHMKERCKSCGLWKHKAVGCVHCSARPNRMQAAVAAVQRPASSLSLLTQMLGDRSGSLTLKLQTLKVPYDPPKPPSLSPVQIHRKQRCHGCGLWVAKDKGCSLCESQPNRHQVYEALVKRASSASPPTRAPLGRNPSFG